MSAESGHSASPTIEEQLPSHSVTSVCDELGIAESKIAPRLLILYGSLRETSFSRRLAEEVERVLRHFGAEVRVSHPHGPRPRGAVSVQVACARLRPARLPGLHRRSLGSPPARSPVQYAPLDGPTAQRTPSTRAAALDTPAR